MEDVEWHICEGKGICIHCGATIHEYCYPKKEFEMIMGIEELDAFDNSQLESQARNLHGALYKRINRVQRDLNIARETIKKQKSYIQELETTNRDLSKMHSPLKVTVQFPDRENEVIYKLVRE